MYLQKTFTGLVFILVSTTIFAQQSKTDTSKPAGDPLIILNGKEYPGLKISQLDSLVKPNDISSLNVLKGQAGIALYGENAKDGVIQIFTKKKADDSTMKASPDTTRRADTIREISDDESIIFEKTEIEAAFPGGPAAWRSFLMNNLRADVPSEKGAPAGTYTIWLHFIVDKEGNLSDFTALTNFGYGMEKECLRLMKLSPNWVPAMQNGHPVKAYKKQAITFQIERQ